MISTSGAHHHTLPYYAYNTARDNVTQKYTYNMKYDQLSYYLCVRSETIFLYLPWFGKQNRFYFMVLIRQQSDFWMSSHEVRYFYSNIRLFLPPACVSNIALKISLCPLSKIKVSSSQILLKFTERSRHKS